MQFCMVTKKKNCLSPTVIRHLKYVKCVIQTKIVVSEIGISELEHPNNPLKLEFVRYVCT